MQKLETIWNNTKAVWDQNGTLTVVNCVEEHLNSTSAKGSWGTTFGLQILAHVLRKKNIENQLITHNMGSNKYYHLTRVKGGEMKFVKPEDIRADDIFVVNTGAHWAPTRYDPNISEEPLLEESDEEEGGKRAEDAIVL